MSSEFWLGILIAIPVGILTNLATPWVKSFYEKSSLSIRERRLYLLQKRYKRVRLISENQGELIIYALLFNMRGIFSILFLVFGIPLLIISREGVETINIVLDYIGSFLMVFLSVSALVQMVETYIIIIDAVRFEKYQKEVIKEIEKLGGNPEDFDGLVTVRVLEVDLTKVDKEDDDD